MEGVDGTQGAEMNYWRQLHECNPHVNILNASGGVLDVFPRIQMSELPNYPPAAGV